VLAAPTIAALLGLPFCLLLAGPEGACASSTPLL
jgi:hypothetical protein